MPRAARLALLVGLVTACGDELDLITDPLPDTTGPADPSSSSGATTDEPTGTGAGTSTSGMSDSSDESSTGTTEPVAPTTGTGADTSTGADASAATGASTGDTTTTGDTSTSTDDTSTSSTSTDESTTSTDESTGTPNLCGAPAFPDLSAPPAFTACPAVQQESRWCLMLGGDDSVTALGLDSQSACVVAPLQSDAIDIFAVGSIGVVGGELFTCTTQFDGVVARVTLATGAVELSGTACTAVTQWRGHIVVQQEPNFDDTIRIYPDWDAVVQDQSVWDLQPPGIFNETLTTQGDVLYAAWHADVLFDRWDLPCGDPLGPVMLEGFDDWMQGIAVADDLRFHTHGFSYAGVRSFDAATGAAAQDFPAVPVDGVGLACFLE